MTSPDDPSRPAPHGMSRWIPRRLTNSRLRGELLDGIAGALQSSAPATLLIGLAATILQHGIVDKVVWELALFTCVAMAWLSAAVLLPWYRAADRAEWWRVHRRGCVFSVAWTAGSVILLMFGPVLPVWYSSGRGTAFVAWSELFLLLSGGSRLLAFVSHSSQRGNPALLFVVSFLVLILVGTGLLMLPGAQTGAGRPDSFAQRLEIALFTSTSASCVTGLAVVPTGGVDAYWSRFGQVVILMMFQIGGLGMMTISAMFALILGRRLNVRESLAVSEVTEAVTIRDVRYLMFSILGFTLAAEVVGALLLTTLWPGLPMGERFFFGAFHSVSAFCNAGFSLTDNSFVGLGNRWQVWGVVCGLIVVGSLGFGTMMSLLQAVWDTVRQRRESLFRRRRMAERLALSPRLVLTTTATLLVGGTVVYWLLESVGVNAEQPVSTRIAEAWFQSVTFRTAGFNTVDHGALEPATRLFAIGLMFIGASPGSTGGGIKTAAVAITVLSLFSVLKGRRKVECHGRSIPDDQVRYAFVIVSMGMACTMLTTLLLTFIERERFPFLDLMFEATSAFATVGVSTGLTADLSTPSRLVLIATMFIGRIGPLTLLLALTRHTSHARFEYPEERIVLG